MPSAEVVCCKKLPNITDKLSIEANSVDYSRGKQHGPRTDCSYSSCSGYTLFAIEAS